MPLYVYEVVLADGSAGKQFEVFQKMADDPLAAHPESGEPVRRVYAEASAPRTWTDAHGKAATSDKKLAANGFTKYVKTANGSYEKTTGAGPKKIQRK